MRIIPVIDVLNGVVVRGVGGRRSEYRPIVSQLTSSVNPVEVARVLVDTFQPAELYLADLDAIADGRPSFELYRAIREMGVRLWVDAGIRDGDGAKTIADTDCEVVAGLETVPGTHELKNIVDAVDVSHVVFSLDLRDGVPLRDWDWRAAIGFGITRVIVLDLARVGTGSGSGTDDLCREIASTFPQVEVIAGGGVAGPDDLRRLAICGVRGVLVASALHDGRLKASVEG
ncbi:MAG TPA: HisA/HisF-related TIM barrel protein, partial [Gemmataceae bacterium]|nr:HisA/HisF-related TIM barrel protein [Gemmataceae bacterium]